ncbi:MAG: hypothetical protein L0H96_11795 [Humibacillus sp.]|nr:hypothetical protein [Humibacillus sp.]MDN5777586.1 hypothetical protein [Humibacillus sp.]
MAARAEGSGGWVSSAVALLALAAAGWFGLGLTTPSPQPSLLLTDASNSGDASQTGSGEPDSSIPAAWRGDHTRPTLNPEARPAVVRQGAPVRLFAHGADTGSGVASQSCHTGRLPGFDRPGVHTVTCLVRDRAGNIAVGRTTYRVIGDAGARPTRV